MLNINDTAHQITRSDLNLALKFLLCLDIIMNPLFHTDFSISDSLKNFRKSVLIYETIIILFILIIDSFSLNYRITNQFVIIQIFHMHIYCTDLMIFISIIIIDINKFFVEQQYSTILLFCFKFTYNHTFKDYIIFWVYSSIFNIKLI